MKDRFFLNPKIFLRQILPLLWGLNLMACADSPLSFRELIAGQNGKVWRLTDIQQDGIHLDVSGCLADNRLAFQPDGRFILNLGISKCNPEEPDVFQRNWVFNEAETYLLLSDDPNNNSLATSYEIIQLSELFLEWRYAVVQNGRAVIIQELWERE